MQMGHLARSGALGILIKSQLRTKMQRAPAGTDLSGQIGIITGASGGLGFQSARHLLSLKLARLIITVRSLKKGEDAAQRLRKEYPHATIDIWILEMTSYSSIQEFCQQVDSNLTRVDFVILNAGMTAMDFALCSSTGHEQTVQVNYLSTFLLSIILLPVLKTKSPAGRPGRLTIVSSGTALFAKLPNRDKRPLLGSFDDLSIQKWDPAERYWSSKMLGHLFFPRLIKYLNPDDVIVNLVDPGYCKGTDLMRSATGAVGMISNMSQALLGRTPEDGAWTYVDAAIVQGKESHGCFCADWEIQPSVLPMTNLYAYHEG